MPNNHNCTSIKENESTPGLRMQIEYKYEAEHIQYSREGQATQNEERANQRHQKEYKRSNWNRGHKNITLAETMQRCNHYSSYKSPNEKN